MEPNLLLSSMVMFAHKSNFNLHLCAFIVILLTLRNCSADELHTSHDILAREEDTCQLILRKARNLLQKSSSTKDGDKIVLPSLQVNGEFEHANFWEENSSILSLAWSCYHDDILRNENVNMNEIMFERWISPTLMEAAKIMYSDKDYSELVGQEEFIKSLWENMVPFDSHALSNGNSVYKSELLTEEGIRWVRSHLDKVDKSGLPTRRPNGMNRKGYIIDDVKCTQEDYVPGAVCFNPLSQFVNELVRQYVRPMGRLLYPEFVHVKDDIETFAFTIRYDGKSPTNTTRILDQYHEDGTDIDELPIVKDVELAQHRDASVVTININLNLPEENYSGSSLFFVNEQNGQNEIKGKLSLVNVTMDSGSALLHRGAVPHGAYPIHEGCRHNLIIWLFGHDGFVRSAPYSKWEQTTFHQRWQL